MQSLIIVIYSSRLTDIMLVNLKVGSKWMNLDYDKIISL